MTTFNIDPAHSSIGFSAKHMMVTTVRGTFTDASWSIDLDEADPTRSKVELRIQAKSIETGFGARDTHLRSADFFDAGTHPEIVIRSTAIRPRKGNEYVVTADVTIRDVTLPVDFDVAFLGFYQSMDGSRRAGFSVSGSMDRKAWGLDWNVALETGGWLVGDRIKLTAEIAVQEATEAAEPTDATESVGAAA
jgi:polyisoprenoid-binding protein YceI